MSTTEITLAAISSIGAGGYGLARYWLRLRFLTRAFERNGDRRDLEVAGKVTAPGWLARGERTVLGEVDLLLPGPPASPVRRQLLNRVRVQRVVPNRHAGNAGQDQSTAARQGSRAQPSRS